jgi:hypothetical protein
MAHIAVRPCVFEPGAAIGSQGGGGRGEALVIQDEVDPQPFHVSEADKLRFVQYVGEGISPGAIRAVVQAAYAQAVQD